MRILYINQYFIIPSEPGGTRSYWIAQELIKNGHQVIMVTANSKAVLRREVKQIDGIKVIYLKETYSQDMSVSVRLKAFLRFSWKSIKESAKQKDIDLVIATSTPLTVGITALFMKWFKKVPYVFEVRDLWPEVPIQMGAFKNPLIIKATRWFEKKIYTNAEHVIALSPGMQEGVMKYIPKEKTSMIPNMSKIDQFWPRPQNRELLNKLQLKEDSFKAIYFGALGLANGAEIIIDAAILLKRDPSVEFIFLSKGSTEAGLIEKCKNAGLSNVRFPGLFPMKETSEIVNLCNVSLVTFKDLPILYTNSPNKLFDSLSAGKPIIVNSAGWTKQMVEENNCGFYVDPHQPQELVDKIKLLQANPELALQMGKKARELAATTYDKSLLCGQFVKVINSLKTGNQV
ncbi:MAG TPA: glycosyltransferase family 4 protein [Agriterribacter sp.]|nr:glycosyltransferase family 4 protein [Agriterribacter sp.]